MRKTLKSAKKTPGKANAEHQDIQYMIGEKVIIRTESAGVWYGTLDAKLKNEVILKDAVRMWRWWAMKSISLSAVAKYGVHKSKCKFAPAIESVLIQAIEILPTTPEAQKLIEEVPEAEQQ